MGVKHHSFLELQWQGRGGKFRHLAITSLGARRVLGSVGIVALFAVVGVFSVASGRNPARVGVDTLLRENTELKARQNALRERAFDLADELYARAEQGRRMARLGGTARHAWEGRYPHPPARDAGNEAILAWLSEQGVRLEALGNDLAVGRAEMGVKRASVPAPVSKGPVPVQDAAVLPVVDRGSVRRHEAAPAGN